MTTKPEPNPPAPRRHALWLLLIPLILYILTPVVANRIDPIVLGMPFIIFYTVVVTILTFILIGLTALLDPVFKRGADEPLPAEALEVRTTGEAGPQQESRP